MKNEETHLPKRKSVRLQSFDYSQAYWYYVTICIKNLKWVFGDVSGETMKLNKYGKIVEENWKLLENQFENIKIDKFVIMPNHFHGILIIGKPMPQNSKSSGLMNQAPTVINKASSWIMTKNEMITLGKIIRFFKARSAKQIHDSGSNDFEWQRNYFEHIIRGEKDLNNICNYIRVNPLKWEFEKHKHLSNW